MKNFKYVTLAALLLSSMVVGCNSSWNPFRKKPVVADPPLAPVTTVDKTNVGADPVRPDPVVDPPVVVKDDPVPLVTPPATGTTYTIKKKDTLWSIAVAHLGNGQRYREIIAANPGLDPQKLAIGQTIKIPPK